MNIKNREQFRKDLGDFFRSQDIATCKRLQHCPFIVLTEDGLELCDNSYDLMKYPPETEVIKQWRGEWSSNFFLFTVKDVIDYGNATK